MEQAKHLRFLLMKVTQGFAQTVISLVAVLPLRKELFTATKFALESQVLAMIIA